MTSTMSFLTDKRVGIKMNSDIVYSTETTLYQQYEAESKDPYNLVCIDGKKVGRKKCLGYCRSNTHPGFLQKKHILQHKCLEKECALFTKKTELAKSKVNIKLTMPEQTQVEEIILHSAKEQVKAYEGLAVVKVQHIKNDIYRINYITLSNEYDLNQISEDISKATGKVIEMKEIECDLDTTVKLILSKDNK